VPTNTGIRLLSRGAVLACIAAVWVFVLSISVPRLWPGNYDYGFFTAIAERLRAGDVLYQDVWDNKDPFIFYSLALARTFGPAGAWALELLWITASCAALFLIARSMRLGRWDAAFVAFAAAPIAMLGVPYFMGTSHLPGIALTLLSLALALRKHPVLAGIPLGLLVFAKFVMLPVAVAVVITALLMRRSRASLRGLAIGTAVTTGAIALLLQLRGELTGFAATQVDNILYSQSPIVQASYTGWEQKIAQHVVILINPNVLAIEIASVAVLVLAGIVHRRAGQERRWPDLPVLWWTSIVALAVSGVTIAVTGKWLHHAEIFVVPSALLLVLLVGTLRIELRTPIVLVGVITLIAAYLFAGRPTTTFYAEQVTGVGASWQEAQRTDELTAILQPLPPSSVAFVGRGTLLPRSSGLEEWTIACRHMAQRPFNPTSMFDETLECLPTAERIVITRDFDRDTAFPEYVEFFDQVEALIARDYSCEETGGFRVCTRTSDGQVS